MHIAIIQRSVRHHRGSELCPKFVYRHADSTVPVPNPVAVSLSMPAYVNAQSHQSRFGRQTFSLIDLWRTACRFHIIPTKDK